MKNYLFIILSSFLIIPYLSADTLSNNAASKFVTSLIQDRNELSKFVEPEELEISNRLGIVYKGVDNKFLISNDIDSSLRRGINDKSLNFTYKIEKLDNNYSKLFFSIPSQKFTREYFFKDSYLISPPFYFGRNWVKEESKFFIFHLSNQALFNNYAEKRLDNFVESICKILKFSDEQIKKLEKNKIHYYLCKDGDEIKKLTGYNARGLYYLPYDYIITTFNCHYHEILHLLINYKIQHPSLYTLPLLQEGFAVTFGGRGGKEPDVILEMGAFLANNNFLNYNSLLSKKDFSQFDATMTYPFAGLYNKFLITELGLNKYLTLYKKYSGDESYVEKLKINPVELPPKDSWIKYLKNYSDSNSIKIEITGYNKFNEIDRRKNVFVISANPNYYLFQIKDTLLLTPPKKDNNYQSKLFHELFPYRQYQNEKYAIIADSDEVSVYNFYSNNLIAKYVRSFSSLNKKVKKRNGFYYFVIKKEIFGEPLDKLKPD